MDKLKQYLLTAQIYGVLALRLAARVGAGLCGVVAVGAVYLGEWLEKLSEK